MSTGAYRTENAPNLGLVSLKSPQHGGRPKMHHRGRNRKAEERAAPNNLRNAIVSMFGEFGGVEAACISGANSDENQTDEEGNNVDRH
jgi:hypothetical protein